MTDIFATNASSITAPAQDGFSITPNDEADLPQVTRALYCGTGGTLVVKLLSGATLTFINVPAGSFLPIRVVRVHSAGTTAGALVGLL